MKKKLLLVGVAAMGLLAVGVGATSTFAWYQAGAAGSKAASNTATQTSLTAVDPNYNVATDLPITVTVERVGTLGVDYYYADASAQSADTKTWRSLELGEWLTAAKSGANDVMDNTWSSAGLWHAYYNSTDSKYHYKNTQLSPTAYFVTATGITAGAADASNTSTPRDVEWAEYIVKVAPATTGDLDAAAVGALIEDSKVQIEVDRKTDVHAGSRSMFFDLKASTSTSKVCSLGAGNSDPSALENVVLDGVSGGSEIIVAHFGMYVNGDDSGTRDTTGVYGDFTVTVTGTAGA